MALKWETIEINNQKNPTSDRLWTQRSKIPGGWLVRSGEGVTFVPDPDHKWNGHSLD